MKRRSIQLPRIRLLSAEAVLLLALCLLGGMFSISALRLQLARNIAHAVRTNPSHFQATMSPNSGMAPAINTATKPVRHPR